MKEWTPEDQQTHFYRACMFDDFCEFLENDELTASIYDDIWERFRKHDPDYANDGPYPSNTH